MDKNRDWKPIAALVLAGMALFVALSGRWSISMSGGADNQQVQAFRVETAPQPFMQVAPTVVPPQSVNPGPGFMQTMPGMPQAPQVEQHFWGGSHFGPWGPFGGSSGGILFRALFFSFFAFLLIFVGLRLLRRNRWRQWSQA